MKKYIKHLSLFFFVVSLFLFFHPIAFACDTTTNTSRSVSCSGTAACNPSVHEGWVTYTYRDLTTCTQLEYFSDAACVSPASNPCSATCTSDSQCGEGTCASGTKTASQVCSGDIGSDPKWCQGFNCGYWCPGGPGSGTSCQKIAPGSGFLPPKDVCDRQCMAPPITTTPAPTLPPGTTPPPSQIVCDSSYGTCGCTGGGCRDGANTDYSCCHRECVSNTCGTVFGAGTNSPSCASGSDGQSCGTSPVCIQNVTKCSSQADCNGGQGTCNSGVCTECTRSPACGGVSGPNCQDFFAQKSQHGVIVAGTKTQSISQQANTLFGLPIPVINVTEGDAVEFRSNMIWSGDRRVTEAKYFYNQFGTPYCEELGSPKDPDGPADYCHNLVQDSSNSDGDTVVDGDLQLTVGEITNQNKHRKFYGTAGTYTYQYVEQNSCNHTSNDSNRCEITVNVQPDSCQKTFCNAMGYTGAGPNGDNCFSAESKKTLNRGQFIHEVVQYHVNMFPVGDPNHWDMQDTPETLRHFKDVCKHNSDDGTGQLDGCSYTPYYDDVETAAHYGFLNQFWNALNNYPYGGPSNNQIGTKGPIMAIDQDWLRDFKGVIGSGDWSGGYGATNVRLTLGLLRKYMYDYGKEKGHFSCSVAPVPHTATGNVFLDNNKDGKKDNGEVNYKGGITITANNGGSVSKNDALGTFTVSNLFEGIQYQVSSLLPPGGYVSTMPNTSVGLPTFLVGVGSTYSVFPSEGDAFNNAGNITNLDFGITNLLTWQQFSGFDMRFDNTYTATIPDDPICSQPPYALTPLVATKPLQTTGISFVGPGSTFFGASASYNKANAHSWVANEPFGPQKSLKTSYTLLLNEAKKNGLPLLPLEDPARCPVLNPCSLSSLPSGIYTVDSGDVYITNSVITGGKNIIILSANSIHFIGFVTVDTTSTIAYIAQNNIIVDPSVGSSPVICPVTGNIMGYFSAGKNFILPSQKTADCSVADKQLLVEGSVTVNANRTGGTFQNNRDLCDNNDHPSVFIKKRLDFLIHAPEFLKSKILDFREVAP